MTKVVREHKHSINCPNCNQAIEVVVQETDEPFVRKLLQPTKEEQAAAIEQDLTHGGL
jgi:C4-type Zn-finger protein